MTPLRDCVNALEAIAPTRLAEPWDNVGLLVGDQAQMVKRAMFCIDYTPEVACEAAGAAGELIVAYHPPIFAPLKRLAAGGSIYDAIQRGVAIYSPHTAWDVAEGGTNDLLADIVGIESTSRRPLRLIEPKDSQYKLVTFVPAASADTVAEALFAAGAGHIGDYSHCSFRSIGTGTFVGEPGKTHPSVGRSGVLEQAAEVRIETVAPIARIENLLAALRQSHPYEEPAFDLVKLAAAPEKVGQGRIGELPATSRNQLIARIKRELGLEHLLVAGPMEGEVSRAAVCAGSCGDLINDALAQGAQFLLTGELRHHDALKAAGCGLTVVCTLHSNSERASLRRLMTRLSEVLPSLQCHLSTKDVDPFSIL